MNRSSANTSIFLIELVLAILVFAVCAAIGMRVFAGAQLMTQESAALGRSVMEAESAAECYKAAQGDLAKTAALYGGSLTDGDTLTAFFDRDWVCAEDADAYLLMIETKENGYAEISVSSRTQDGSSRILYSLTVKAVM